MYRHLSELVVRVFDLAEAEGRVLRAQLSKIGIGLAIRWVAGVVLLVGLVMIGVALWLGVAEVAGPAWASLATGVLGVSMALALFWIAGRVGV